MKFEYSIGNSKIGKDTLIFNMGSAVNCPSKALGLCTIPDGLCYARKAERQYTSVLPYRERQAEYWQGSLAETIANDIKGALSHKRKTAIRFVRANESGDFYSTDCIDKLIAIAKLVPMVTFYCYTHRTDIIASYKGKLPFNLVITISDMEIQGFNCFKAVREYTDSNLKCAGNCRNCMLCKKQHGRTIEVLLH